MEPGWTAIKLKKYNQCLCVCDLYRSWLQMMVWLLHMKAFIAFLSVWMCVCLQPKQEKRPLFDRNATGGCELSVSAALMSAACVHSLVPESKKKKKSSLFLYDYLNRSQSSYLNNNLTAWNFLTPFVIMGSVIKEGLFDISWFYMLLQ